MKVLTKRLLDDEKRGGASELSGLDFYYEKEQSKEKSRYYKGVAKA